MKGNKQMARIRPLFSTIEKSNNNGFTGSLENLRDLLPDGSDVPAKQTLAETRKALNWLLITQNINNFSASPTDVANHLMKIKRRADKYRTTRKSDWKDKLKSALSPPQPNVPGADIAKLIAVEYVAVSSLVMKEGYPLQGDNLGGRAIDALNSLDLDQTGTLEWIAYWARCQRQLILEDQSATAERLSTCEGTEFIEGQNFQFRPDPLEERYTRPLSDCIDIFVGQLCLIYRRTGGSTFLPRDGRPCSPFESFLEAILLICPAVGKHGSLASRARRVQQEEVQGTRFLGFEQPSSSQSKSARETKAS